MVVSQAWRDGRRQARLGRFLRTCEIGPTLLEGAKAAGILCGKTCTSDVVHATVIVVASTRQAIVFTSDPRDLAKLAAESGARPGFVIRTV